MLDDIIAILILTQLCTLLNQLLQQESSVSQRCKHGDLFSGQAILKDTLNDTTTISMLSHLKDAALEGSDEKGRKCSGDTFNTLLDDMIAILISHKLKNMSIQFMHHSTLISAGRNSRAFWTTRHPYI